MEPEHLAERPKDGEFWREMIERQKQERNNEGDSPRELLRSLPLEQKEKGRGDLFPPHEQLAEVPLSKFQEYLREVPRRGEPERGLGIDR